MAQQTNLNVSPYFDDFDPNDNYQKILFKPGYPVQARELTGLQSILQNQIEKFGQHFFKEGAKVIPGNTAYSSEYFAVELNNSHLGVPVEFYIDQLIDRKIIGATTGVTAIIKQILMSENSENGNLTLITQHLQLHLSLYLTVFILSEVILLLFKMKRFFYLNMETLLVLELV